MKRADRFSTYGLATTLVLHGGLALALVFLPPPVPRQRRVIEMDIRKREPPPPAPPITPPAPEPPKPEPPKKIVKQPRPAETPRPSKTAEPPRPATPVAGITPDQLSQSGTGIAVQGGNTTLGDMNQKAKAKVEPLPQSTGAPGKEFHPVAETDLAKLPDHDPDTCFEGLKDKYSRSDAYANGIEGDVVFRIELDEQGKIHSIRKVKGIGGGIDEMAMGWLRFNPKCKFTPAIGKDGKPAAFVIDRYPIHFVIGQ